ncbi:helix-turn-helix domain-containing protein [Streptomyces xanthochromogenes]|uniref:helix-turn-helix domain-containing protein n=1 Tax=Streptomyces xanthochromogenes TaxID=67384 RepID=UPI00382019DE
MTPSESLEGYLGGLVRAGRERLGKDWTQTYLATQVFENQSLISRIERGLTLPQPRQAYKLERVLGLSPGTLVDLVLIRERQTVRDYAKDFLTDQDRATAFYTLAPVVPGLLQTADYARRLMIAGQTDPSEIESFVRQRLDRQRVWDRKAPPWMNAVLDEAILHRSTEAQLKRLLEVQEQPNVTIRVLEMSQGPILGTVVIQTLPNGRRGAYTEGFQTGAYTKDEAQVLHYQRVYDQAANSALTAVESTEVITQALKRYK